jgi:hypothetical protein
VSHQLPGSAFAFLENRLRRPLARLLDPSSLFSALFSRLLRYGSLAFLLVALMHPLPRLNAALSSFYSNRLLASGLLHWPMLEAVWAVLAFFFTWALYIVPGSLLNVARIDGREETPRRGDAWFWAAANTVM